MTGLASHAVNKFYHLYDDPVVNTKSSMKKINMPKQDLNLAFSGTAVFEDCKATALTSQPPQQLINYRL